MSKILVLAGALSAALCATSFMPSTASAEVLYPWCFQAAGRDGGYTNCGFTSYGQCRATASGIGGYCYRNPRYYASRDYDHPRRGYYHRRYHD